MLSDDRQLIETPISDETVFRGALIDVSHMQVRLPNGRTALREIVHHKGAAAIVPVDDEEYVYLVRQHRVVNDMLTWEIPAGKLDTADEDPLHCAVRELREETGFGGGQWSELMVVSANPSTQTNLTHCFVATAVERISEPHLESTEDLTVHLLTPGQVRDLLLGDRIKQALHAAPLWRYFAENRLL